jgi:hypothetical protein
MTDIATISAITNSVKTAIDIAKAIKDADVSLEKAELKLRVAELVSTLADTKIASTEIVELLKQKDAKIEDLKEKLRFKEKLVRSREAYYEIDEAGKPFGDPYCSHCWEAKFQAIHLHRKAMDPGQIECPSCKTVH